jgi:hypothetical protein
VGLGRRAGARAIDGELATRDPRLRGDPRPDDGPGRRRIAARDRQRKHARGDVALGARPADAENASRPEEDDRGGAAAEQLATAP